MAAVPQHRVMVPVAHFGQRLNTGIGQLTAGGTPAAPIRCLQLKR